jgi:C-terminal processing protease CtpA/Prc
MRTLPLRLTLLAVFATAPLVPAQAPPGADKPLDADGRKAVIDGVLEKIEAHYVFPDAAKKMAEAVREKAAKKEYDSITSSRTFATRLTEDLRAICKDKHLGVRFNAEPLPKDAGRGPTPAEIAKQKEMAALRNFGFKKVERLGTGGVGLLELENFLPADAIADTAAAAYGFLAGNDAIIIDLRKNGGGSPDGVILLCSYFFSEPTHLNSIYTRTTDSTKEYRTHDVKGQKLLDKDVYVLTSNRTFSAAEEFTYNLQNQKRATIVGETTGGGAHPTRGFRVTDHFTVGVPFARSINPVSQTNWEGTGVKPDVECKADDALTVAHRLALEKAAKKYAGDKDKSAAIKRELDALSKAGGEKAASAEAPKYSVGVKLEIDGGTVTVAETIKGSPAERDGIKAGDRLVKVNGKALAEDPAILGREIQTGKPITVEVEREGKPQTVVVTPKAN